MQYIMARKSHGWDISNQHIFTEAVRNENSIRSRWFEKNRQRLMDNLEADRSGTMKKKLKKLKEKQDWEVTEHPIDQIPSKRRPPPAFQQEIKESRREYMRPVDPKVLAILYEKDKTSNEARMNYLEERYKTKPEDKFYTADCTNWNYGWRLKDHTPIESSNWGQISTVKGMFFEKTIPGLECDSDLSRKPQATYFTKSEKMLKYPPPRWYQELSLPQMKRVFTLGKIIKCDHEETVTGRTRKSLREIGITSSFVKISPKYLKKFFKVSKLDPVLFLCEIYRYITGYYFEEEGYKNFYDCNERIVLSAIAFLKFPETIIELHRRLPMGKSMKLPKKPVMSTPEKKTRKSVQSPYLQETAEQPNWRSYRSKLEKWREKVKSIVRPSVILPKLDPLDERTQSILEPVKKSSPRRIQKSPKKKTAKQNRSRSIIRDEKKSVKSEIGQVDIFFSDNDSVDDFAELDAFVKDLPKKFFPPGRENLSSRWQTWLQDRENEFEELAEEADCLLKEVREITKLIYNPNACENCCACRESRKRRMNKQELIPSLLIDSVLLDDDDARRVIGTMTLNSPTPSLTDSQLNLPQIIPSDDKIVKKKIINGVILDENNAPKYLISEVIRDVQHIPKKIRHLPKVIKNVHPCSCKANDDIEEIEESDIPCAVDGECIAKKYRPNEFTGCRKCSDEHSTNKIYRDFEKACKERDDQKSKLQVPIDHTTCTHRLFRDDERKTEVEHEPEKCTKCFEALGKCQPSPFKDIIDQINKSKLLDKSKGSHNTEMKLYRDNIKLAVGGMMQIDTSDNKMVGCILSGIALHTPITITPSVSSNESDLPILSSGEHHHWSVTAFTPKPKVIKMRKANSQYYNSKSRKISKKRIKTAIDELISKVHELDLLKEKFNDRSVPGKNEESIGVPREDKPAPVDKTEKSEMSIRREKGGGDVDLMEHSDDEAEIPTSGGERKLPQLMKITLKEMAGEGFIFAKLPDCHKVPQLQAWIMFREGFVLTGKRKSALLERTKQLWNQAESRGPVEITAPTMQISEKTKETLTRADLYRIERELKYKKELFHSKIRKLRVLESRAMWNLMDYQMFPSLAFKQAYFVYQPSKESDGHVERPYGFLR